jgi:hypothetical protein
VKNIKMKSTLLRYSLLSIALSIVFSISCIAQSGQTTNQSPKVENYTFGAFDLKLNLFGVGKEIIVGKINENGSIEFNWPEFDSDTISENTRFMEAKDVFAGMSYCEDDEIEENTGTCLVVNTGYIYLFKNDTIMGILFPATAKDILENKPANVYANLTLGSSISWFYSKETCLFKANCSDRIVWEGKYDFNRERNYDIQLKEGWNIVAYNLTEKEEWDDEFGLAHKEKKASLKTLNKIPENINWYIKMF